MAYPATDFSGAVGLTMTAANQLHEVMNGSATETVSTESGEIPTLRKALVDNFYFASPIDWVVGEDETVFNQVRKFTDGTFWVAPTATLGTPVEMTADPYTNPLWSYSLFNAPTSSEALLQDRQTGDGVQTVFDAPHTEDGENPALFYVTKDGLKQRPITDYTTSTAGEVVFTSAPEEDVAIDIIFFKSIKRELSIPTGVDVSTSTVIPVGYTTSALNVLFGEILDNITSLEDTLKQGATDIELNSATSAVNTTNKYAGKQIFNTDLSVPVYAKGSLATDAWVKYSDNTDANVPV